MDTVNEYTITIFTENHVGLLSRISSVFTRRKINIESLTVSESAIQGIHKFTVKVDVTEKMIQHINAQINKLVEVLMAYFHPNEEIVYQEIALYKIPTKALTESNKVESIIRKHGAKIIEVTPNFTAIHKTGHRKETQLLFEELKEFNILQFVRSGRIAITRTKEEKLSELLSKVDKK